MSEASRSRVTITLGGMGQVVKMAGSSLDNSLDEYRVAGSKRPVRDRLGRNVDSSIEVNDKRMHKDGGTADAFCDGHLSKDDLRYKIMQKNRLKQNQNNQQSGGDLRNILSRPAQSSTNGIATRERMPEPKDIRPHYLEPTNGRQDFSETNSRSLLPVTRNANLPIPEFRVGHAPDPRKQYTRDAREGERSIFETKDVRLPMPEPRSSDIVTRVLSAYSPWTLDRLRRRSPDESLASSRGLTAPKNDEIFQRRYADRPYADAFDVSRPYADAFDVSRPVSTSSLTKMAQPVEEMKTTAPVPSPLPLSGSLGKKKSYTVDDQDTIDSFLRSMGLEKFAVAFKAEEVDMYSLRRMSERDLKELGIPMGPRKKILLSLQPLMKLPAV